MNENLIKKINTYAQNQRKIYNAVLLEAPLMNNFSELSRAGNRREMIELLMKLPQVKNLVISDCYQAKDNELANNVFKEALRIIEIADKTEDFENSFNQTIDLLNKALFAAFNHTKKYLEILMKRTHFWYRVAKFQRCLKDIKYVIDDLSCNFSDGEISDYYEECKIECLLLESECYKQLKLEEGMKNALNKGMRAVNDFIQSRCSNESHDVLKTKKLQFLQMHLEKLSKIKPKNSVNSGVFFKKTTIPCLFGQSNQLIKSCSDAIALGQDAIRGRYLFAVRNIQAGSPLIIDQPFSFSTDVEALNRNCLHCHVSLEFQDSVKVPCSNCQMVSYCSEKCRKESWDRYHKYECRIFGIFLDAERKEHQQQWHSPLSLAYRTTVVTAIDDSAKLNLEFLNFHSFDGKAEEFLKLKLSDTYDQSDYRTVYSLQTHCIESDPKENLLRAVRSVFLTKCLAFLLKTNEDVFVNEAELVLLATVFLRYAQVVNCNAYEVVENLRDPQTRVWEPRNIGGAIYPTVSLSNHSCYPNVVRHSYPQGIVVVRAMRFIKKGAEILDCYGPHFLTNEKQERQKYLLRKYHFNCVCEACSNNWSSNLPANETRFKCSSCSKAYAFSNKVSKCSDCGGKIDSKKMQRQLRESMKKRVSAISMMFDGNYAGALPLLLDHANFTEKFLVAPSFEAIKTQQSIVQCFNSLSCTSQM